MSAKKPRIQLLLDFDGTITENDTTSIIGSRCINRALELAPSSASQDDLPKGMEYYSDLYMRELRAWKDSHPRPPAKRRTIDEEVEVLSRSRKMERDSFLRVREALEKTPGEFRDVYRDEISRDAFMTDAGREAIRSGEVRIRDSDALKKLIHTAEEDEGGGGMWGIISVSWSRRFILGTLLQEGLITEAQVESVAERIKCNELLLAPEDLNDNTAGDERILCTARDKRDALQSMLQQHSGPPVRSNDEDAAAITIYVGDSTTDLGALIGPAIGMYLSDSDAKGGVDEALERLGIECVPIRKLPTEDAPARLSKMREEFREQGRPPHIVCKIRGFEELRGWVSALK